MSFDPDRPHAQVYGTPGVQWQQDGRYWRRDGSPVDGDPDRERELREIKTRLTEPDLEPEVREALRERVAMMAAAPAIAPQPPVQGDDMRLAANKALKVQLEVYGEPWQGVAHARRFLEGKE